MIDYIKGKITELTPANVVIETTGIGYFINISLTTYTALANQAEAQLFVYEAIREDAFVLFGFMSREERQLFLLLISVSGIEANTARVIMSSYSALEIQEMIATSNVTALNAIKGIGTKTAQRIIVDLKDKILKVSVGTGTQGTFVSATAAIREETMAALVMLGYTASASQKAIDTILKHDPALSVEQVIKNALKML